MTNVCSLRSRWRPPEFRKRQFYRKFLLHFCLRLFHWHWPLASQHCLFPIWSDWQLSCPQISVWRTRNCHLKLVKWNNIRSCASEWGRVFKLECECTWRRGSVCACGRVSHGVNMCAMCVRVWVSECVRERKIKRESCRQFVTRYKTVKKLKVDSALPIYLPSSRSRSLSLSSNLKSRSCFLWQFCNHLD